MKYNDEIAAVKMAVKRAKRGGREAGFVSIKKYADNHANRAIDEILKCYRKAIKRGIC